MKLFKNKTRKLVKECNDLLQSISSKVDEINKQKKLLLNLETKLDETIAYQKLSLLALYEGCDIPQISKKVFNSYPKATGFLRDVQLCNLYLLSDFKDFCDNLNIRFWLHAGTLIGALRNNGFIQWDDDVDVAMTRCDFNTMRENIKKSTLLELHEYYNDITCSRQYQLKYKNSVPCFIDIVVFDTCQTPQDNIIFWNHYRSIYQELVNEFRKKIGTTKLIDVGYYHVGLYPPNVKKWVDELINMASQKVCSLNIPLSEKPSFFYAIENYPFTYPIIKYDDLYPLKEIYFEDKLFYIPANSEYYLFGYGNIWLPPKDMGKTPHIYAFQGSYNVIKKFLNKRRRK